MRKAFIVEISLDDIPGDMHTQESALDILRTVIDNRLLNYRPRVSLAPALFQPDGDKMDELCEQKYFHMDPETDDLLPNGHALRNGMIVLCGDDDRRLDVSGATQLSHRELALANKYNRWCMVTHVEYEDGQVYFTGIYAGGSKKPFVIPVRESWYVRKDTIPAEENIELDIDTNQEPAWLTATEQMWRDEKHTSTKVEIIPPYMGESHVI